jgi:hypothetical protein
MKHSQFSLGHHPLSDAPYWNQKMAIREQGSDCHPFSGAPYWNLDMVISERVPDHHHLSDALHRRPDVVSNEQRFSHLTRRVRGKRKLVMESRICLVSWNVGSLTSKLRKLINTAIRRRVNTCFKLWYIEKERSRNGVGILVDKRLKNEVIAVRRQGDMIIMIKLIFRDLILNVISAYAPQVCLSDDVKK